MKLIAAIFLAIMAYSAACGYIVASTFGGIDADLWAKIEAASHAP